MQIHELNPFQGTLGSEAFLVVDNGDDTGKISVERLTQPINDRIDDIITSPAPTEQEIIDARRGWNEVVYGSLGTAIRSQVKQILAQFYKFNTYDLLAVYGTPISRTRNGVTFTWDEAGQVCEVSGEAVGGDAYASIYAQTGAWPGIFERGVTYTIGYETTDPNVKLRIAVWEGVETTPDYYYFDENGHFGIPPEAAKISIDLWVASGDTVSAVVKNVYMLRTYTAKEVTATIRDAMIGADRHMYNSLGDAIREQLNGKVDKVTGKVLSSNDFTDAEKTKLSGIEAGSEVNAIEAIKLDGTELTPDENRAVDIPVDETLTVEGVPADAKTVGEGLESKLAIDGYSELATVGNAEQLVATQHITDTEPYIYRKTGGPNDVGDRVYDTIVGGSVVWNQFVPTNKKSGTITPSASASYYSSSVVASGAIIDHVYFMKASFNYKGDKTVVGFLQAGNLPGIEYSSTLVKNTNTTFCAVLKRPTGASTAFVIGINTVDHSINLDDTDAWDYDGLYGVDLTALLTPTIADYIYTLETANAGDGVAWFKKYFPKEYHEFCEPHFEHVQVSAKNTVGFNQWDEEWENGGIDANGNNVAAPGRLRSKNHIPALPETVYFMHIDSSIYPATWYGLFFYDGNKHFISTTTSSADRTFTTPVGTRYIRFYLNDYWDGKEYTSGICINLHGDRDGEYEPYRKRTYPLDSSLTLRGIPKLDSANRLYFDGDVYQHDGSGEKRYSVATFNSCSNVAQAPNGNYYTTFPLSSTGVGITTAGASITTLGYSDISSVVPGQYYITGNGTTLVVCFTDQTLTTKALMDAYLENHPFTIVYKRATPEPFTAEPFQSPMVVDPLGTEEFIDYGVEQGTRDVSIVVGHSSEYPADLRGKLQHLPSLSTSGDGRYVVVQTGNQMTLSPDTSLGLIAALEARVAALEGGN